MYIRQVDSFHFRVHFSFRLNKILSVDERSRIEDWWGVREVEVAGSMPNPALWNRYLGGVPVVTYNYNPYQRALFLETPLTRWLLKQITTQELVDQIETILLSLLDPESDEMTPPLKSMMIALANNDGVLAPRDLPPLFLALRKFYPDLHADSMFLEVNAHRFFKTLIEHFEKTSGLPDPIHIGLCVDASLNPYLYPLIQSILYNTNSQVDFHILHHDPLPEEDLLYGFSNATIHAVQVKDEDLKDFELNKGNEWFSHITKMTYARILLPKLVPQANRLIYLDIDTLVEGDINELWQFNLEGHLLGMAQEPDTDYFEDPLMTPYFQAGVILMDLAGLREAQFEERLRDRSIRELDKFWTVQGQDQGLINREFESDVKKLPVRFNFCSMVISHYGAKFVGDEKMLRALIGDQFYEDIVIFHYAGKKKAWDDPHSPYFFYARRGTN